MTTGREADADWVERLMAQYRDRLTGAVFDGIYQLEGEPLRTVMDAQADACMQAFVALHEIPAHLDLDAFLERMATAGPSRIVLERPDADTILWRELHDGVCVCPHVRQGVIALDPKLCSCGATWVRLLIERHARREAAVSLVESVATGARECVYRISLGAALAPGAPTTAA